MQTNFDGVPCRSKDASLFDVTDWLLADEALRACSQCWMRLECLRTVKPADCWSDGVIGGFVWMNGKPLEREFKRLHPLRKPFADFANLAIYLKERRNNV